MSKKLIAVLIVVIVLVGAGSAWFYITNNQSEGEMIKKEVDPTEYMVFEVRGEDFSDVEKNRGFERFNNAKNIILTNIEKGLELNNDGNFYAWLEMASAQKVVEDYDRAIGIWTWFTGAYPHNSTSPFNLAGVYKSLVVNNKLSEKYYQIALEREKHKFHIYYGLYELYRYNFRDEQKAIDVLKTGLENNPEDRNYVTSLINYMIGVGRLDEAEEVIDEWLVEHPDDYDLREKLEQ